MCKITNIATCFIVLGAVSSATADWDLIGSCPAPGSNPRGIDHTSFEYIVVDNNNPYIYAIYAGNGSIYYSFPAPGGPGAWGLVTGNYLGGPYDGFFLSNYNTSWIYKITSTGSVISSFLSPIPGPADMGYTRDYTIGSRTYISVAIPDQNKIAFLNPTTGSLLKTYPGPGTRPTACGGRYYGDPDYGFCVADDGTDTIYRNGVPVVTGIETPTGFTASFTGNDEMMFAWVVDDATDYIYNYYVWEQVTTEPASLGRIKALFK